MMHTLSLHPQLSSPGKSAKRVLENKTGRSSTPRLHRIPLKPLEYWIPAFAGMTAVIASRAATQTN